ncbi:SDH family Clp fold serine proteinase [Acinetobacter rudis]|uniref:SDH family Clp fold serine proteinase n=1 Tax=Acinetobacter rudis TaxID=632955 RepID=UPI00333F4829
MFEKLNGDVDTIYYIGEISRSGYTQISNTCKSLKKNGHRKAVLFLLTFGGNPHMGFRIARALQHHYEDGFTVVIPSSCKSAGTLISIGATELVIADEGELGPLDIQLSKSTELFEQTSGLDLPQAMSALRSGVTDSIRDVLIEVRMGGRLSTKIASEIATNVTTGIYSPIFAQIDPLRLGELHRATMIAYEYGKKLSDKSENLKQSALKQLIMDYPSHGFVIDRKEAKSIFKTVRSPNENELEIINNLSSIILAFEDQTLPNTVVCFPGREQNNEDQDEIITQENDDELNSSEPLQEHDSTVNEGEGFNDERANTAVNKREGHINKRPRKASQRNNEKNIQT